MDHPSSVEPVRPTIDTGHRRSAVILVVSSWSFCYCSFFILIVSLFISPPLPVSSSSSSNSTSSHQSFSNPPTPKCHRRTALLVRHRGLVHHFCLPSSLQALAFKPSLSLGSVTLTSAPTHRHRSAPDSRGTRRLGRRGPVCLLVGSAHAQLPPQAVCQFQQQTSLNANALICNDRGLHSQPSG